jgi:hypothetical protein
MSRFPADAEGRSLMYRAGDIQARTMLINRAENAYDAGEKVAAASLIHANDYLSDRLAYELCRPPRNDVRIGA